MQKRATGDNIILIGMPAVGKSTVGVLLAKRTGYGFVDTDLLIQSGERQRLHQIIAADGLTAFCDLEASYVQQLEARRTIVATGGSVVYREHAMAYLHTLGLIAFLDIELPELKQRLMDLAKRGVVCTPGQTIDDLYAERQPLYRKYADITIPCTALQPETVVAALISAVQNASSFSAIQIGTGTPHDRM
jgi:shikimate kinase